MCVMITDESLSRPRSRGPPGHLFTFLHRHAAGRSGPSAAGGHIVYRTIAGRPDPTRRGTRHTRSTRFISKPHGSRPWGHTNSDVAWAAPGIVISARSCHRCCIWHVGIRLNAPAHRRIAGDLQVRRPAPRSVACGSRSACGRSRATRPNPYAHMPISAHISEAFRGSRPRNCVQLQARRPEDHPGRPMHLFQRMSLSRALSRCTIFSRR